MMMVMVMMRAMIIIDDDEVKDKFEDADDDIGYHWHKGVGFNLHLPHVDK